MGIIKGQVTDKNNKPDGNLEMAGLFFKLD